ncbi:MAG: YIP1 family protein [Kiloniellales bacterium]|nr:YIP1 family protein [Kiloniellales bacterium]
MTSEEVEDQAAETVRSLPETARMVLLQPVAFFRTMPKSGGFLSPLIYLLVMTAIASVISVVAATISAAEVAGAALFGILLALILLVIGAFIASAILCVIWMMLGSKEKFETAFRVVCYTSTILPIAALLDIIPYFGTAVWVVWGTWLIILASVHAHELARKQAGTVFGIIGAVFLLGAFGFQYAGQQSMKRLEEIQGQFEGLDADNPEDAAKILEMMKDLQRQ